MGVVTDEDNAGLHTADAPGTWHGSSTDATRVLRGSGIHADMLDPAHLPRNAALVRALLTGEADHAG